MCNIILIAQYVSGETILEDFIKREIIILEWILQNSEIKFLFTMKARKVWILEMFAAILFSKFSL